MLKVIFDGTDIILPSLGLIFLGCNLFFLAYNYELNGKTGKFLSLRSQQTRDRNPMLGHSQCWPKHWFNLVWLRCVPVSILSASHTY